ncbi:hypothetical protein ACIGW8_35080 [Streptomyces sioyaensis]|uniref:hypothetical protein n=1 Tax=Streptomyces sioyaensis TaxID=67364 RepID=UPI0037D5E38D
MLTNWSPDAENNEVVEAWALDNKRHLVRRDDWKDSKDQEQGLYVSQQDMAFPDANMTFRGAPAVYREGNSEMVHVVDDNGNLWTTTHTNGQPWTWHNLGHAGTDPLAGPVSFSGGFIHWGHGATWNWGAFGIDDYGNVQEYSTASIVPESRWLAFGREESD